MNVFRAVEFRPDFSTATSIKAPLHSIKHLTWV